MSSFSKLSSIVYHCHTGVQIRVNWTIYTTLSLEAYLPWYSLSKIPEAQSKYASEEGLVPRLTSAEPPCYTRNNDC
jgi:hypothetical protein